MKSQFALRVAAVAAFTLAFSLVGVAQTTASKQITTYMHQARVHSAQAAADLALLQSYSMTGIPWQVDFNRLQHIEDDVNALIKDYNHLSALRANATPSQVDTLDRIQPLLQDLKAQVKESLRYVEYHSAAVNMPPFEQRVHVQYANANRIFSTLCDCAKKNNNVLVASLQDPTVFSDCSDKKLGMPTSSTLPFANAPNGARPGISLNTHSVQ
jgi:hypothetical protein